MHGALALRIAEYAAGAAFGNVEGTADGARMALPHSAVILLRGDTLSQDNYTIEVVYPGGKIKYGVPIIRGTDYDFCDIMDKRLWLLLPFYGFNFVNSFRRMEESGNTEEMKQSLKSIVFEITKAARDNKISGYEKAEILLFIKRVLEKLTIKYTVVQKGVDEVMGGKIIDTEVDVAYERGKKEDAYQMQAGGVPIEKIAQYVSKDVATVEEWLKDMPEVKV